MLSGGAHTHRRISWAAIFGGVFDDTQAKLQQARDQATQTAKNAADASAAAASKTSFAAFGDLLLAAIAAAIGGSLAVQRRLTVAQRVLPADPAGLTTERTPGRL